MCIALNFHRVTCQLETFDAIRGVVDVTFAGRSRSPILYQYGSEGLLISGPIASARLDAFLLKDRPVHVRLIIITYI